MGRFAFAKRRSAALTANIANPHRRINFMSPFNTVSSATVSSIHSLAHSRELEDASPLKRLNLAELLTQPRPKISYLLPGILPGSVGAVVGPGGSGKTMIQLQNSMALALGMAPLANPKSSASLFPAPPRPFKVAFISGEETSLAVTDRLHPILDHLLTAKIVDSRLTFRADYIELLNRNLDIFPANGVDLTLIRRGVRTSMIDDVLRRIEGCDVVFIETVCRLHDGDENTTAAMSAIVGVLEYLAQRSGAAVIATHHTAKGATGHEPSARGSSAFIDNVRWLANVIPMLPEEAQNCGIDELQCKSFVRWEIRKANYMAPTAAVWLRRNSDGVLGVVGPQSQRKSRHAS